MQSAEDPFSMEDHLDDHPRPMANIQVVMSQGKASFIATPNTTPAGGLVYRDNYVIDKADKKIFWGNTFIILQLSIFHDEARRDHESAGFGKGYITFKSSDWVKLVTFLVNSGK